MADPLKRSSVIPTAIDDAMHRRAASRDDVVWARSEILLAERAIRQSCERLDRARESLQRSTVAFIAATETLKTMLDADASGASGLEMAAFVQPFFVDASTRAEQALRQQREGEVSDG